MHEYKAERFFIGLNNKFRSMWDAYEELKDTPHDITPVLENETFKNLKGLKINQDIDYDLVALESIFKKYDINHKVKNLDNFQLSNNLGTLAVGLGCSPLALGP